MVRLIIITLVFFYSFAVFSNDLTTQEKIIFNFIDLDRDKNISLKEINKLTDLIFQLIDENKDGEISEVEILELKKIIESLS